MYSILLYFLFHIQIFPFILCFCYILNENLQQQAQALYKEHFIDMQPFDGAMPEGWHRGTISEIIELHDSKRIPLSSRERANLAKIYPYYGATSVMDYVDRYLFDGIYLLLGEDGLLLIIRDSQFCNMWKESSG